MSGPVAEVQARYEADSDALMRLGAALAGQADDMPRISVRISKPLAEEAVASWEWEQPEDFERSEPETCEQRLNRNRSATLAMIGLSIQEHGSWHEDHVVVALHPWHLGVALEASDDVPDVEPRR